MSWLIDTLAWTAALLALVLVLRRPVARQFGPQAAYALWALPFLRLLLPPIELPAWLAPAEPEAIATHAAYVAIDTGPIVATPVAATAAAAAPLEAAPGFDWLALLPALWLAGAALFLAWRFAAYFRMRRMLLDHARPVGEAGRVRLVETPEIASPLAFGVLDKVVALPIGFMALWDRRARDLALEHELAHHRGRDLLVNFAVQPLFALHWFNPLGWLGWRALRRDQEAACDARVIAARGLGERAAYANVIAEFAAGPRIALAAPMACPVLGDKSIIHRLRSLTMSDVSRRRRFAGRALIGAAALALPLTASITYAEIPAAPAAPQPPVPPAPPVPALAPEAPAAPLPPDAPEAGVQRHVMVVRKADGEGGHHVIRRELRDGEPVFVIDGKKLSEEEFDARMDEFDAQMERLDEELEAKLEDMPRIDEERIRLITKRAERAVALAPEVRMDCSGEGITSKTTSADGKQVIRVCQRRALQHAVTGLRAARAQIARNADMSEEVRAEVLASLDREIARIEAEN